MATDFQNEIPDCRNAASFNWIPASNPDLVPRFRGAVNLRLTRSRGVIAGFNLRSQIATLRVASRRRRRFGQPHPTDVRAANSPRSQQPAEPNRRVILQVGKDLLPVTNRVY